MKESDILFISLSHRIRRSDSLAQLMGGESVTILPYLSHELILNKFINYILYFFKLLLVVKKRRPKVVVFAVPPQIFLYSVPILKLLGIKVLVDMHNGMLLKKWSSWPLQKMFLKNCDKLICHNTHVKKKFEAIYNCEFVVLEDSPPIVDSSYFNSKRILFPFSFSDDEPIYLLKKLDENIPASWNVIVSGNYKKRSIDPNEFKNIQFTGYLNDGEYDDLLLKSSIVVCLTDDSDVQMCALWESVGYGKVIVYTGNEVMKEQIGAAGVAINNEINSLMNGLGVAMTNNEIYTARINNLCSRVLIERKKQFNAILCL